MEYFKKLDTEEGKQISELLFQKLFNGKPIFGKESPFIPKDNMFIEMVIENFGYPQFFRKIISLPTSEKYILKYNWENKVTMDIYLDSFYNLKYLNKMNTSDMYDEAFKLNFPVHCFGFIMFDSSYTWAVVSILDIQFIYGNIEFMKIYFESKDEFQENLDFVQNLNTSDFNDDFKLLMENIRNNKWGGTLDKIELGPQFSK